MMFNQAVTKSTAVGKTREVESIEPIQKDQFSFNVVCSVKTQDNFV